MPNYSADYLPVSPRGGFIAHATPSRGKKRNGEIRLVADSILIRLPGAAVTNAAANVATLCNFA